MYKLKGNINGKKFKVKYHTKEDFFIFLEEKPIFWEFANSFCDECPKSENKESVNTFKSSAICPFCGAGIKLLANKKEE